VLRILGQKSGNRTQPDRLRLACRARARTLGVLVELRQRSEVLRLVRRGVLEDRHQRHAEGSRLPTAHLAQLERNTVRSFGGNHVGERYVVQVCVARVHLDGFRLVVLWRRGALQVRFIQNVGLTRLSEAVLAHNQTLHATRGGTRRLVLQVASASVACVSITPLANLSSIILKRQ
jgi:hypothetical protein